MGAADAGQHGGDMAVLRVEWLAQLPIMPGDPRQPPLQRGDAHRGYPTRPIGAGGEIKPDGLWIRRRHGKTLAAGVILGLFPRASKWEETVRGTIASEARSSSTSLARELLRRRHASSLCHATSGPARSMRPSESVIRILIRPE